MAFAGCYGAEVINNKVSITCSGGHIKFAPATEFRAVGKCSVFGNAVIGPWRALSGGTSVTTACSIFGVDEAYMQRR